VREGAAKVVAPFGVFVIGIGACVDQQRLALHECPDAQRIGVPVVVADLPGPDGEMVMHGQTGWRYPYRAVNKLVQTLAEILRQGNEEVPQIVANAQKEILQRRNLTQYAQAFGHALQRAQPFLHR